MPAGGACQSREGTSWGQEWGRGTDGTSGGGPPCGQEAGAVLEALHRSRGRGLRFGRAPLAAMGTVGDKGGGAGTTVQVGSGLDPLQFLCVLPRAPPHPAARLLGQSHAWRCRALTGPSDTAWGHGQPGGPAEHVCAWRERRAQQGSGSRDTIWVIRANG